MSALQQMFLGGGPAAATYTVTPAAGSINEGSALTINVGGTNITNGTYYWTVTNSGDFTTSSGSFSITSNAGSFTVTPTADVTTEGAETFTVSIRSGSISGTILATSSSITINDTSLATTYTVTPAAASINEGSNLTINVGGTNITNGTYYFTINHITTASGDFSASSGSFSITSNAGSFTVTPTADVTTEGAQTFTVSIRSGSTSGTILATSSSITINDTSTAPVNNLLWQTNRLTSGINFTAGSTSFTSSNVASDGYGVFTGVLPASSFYVDVTLAEGYSSHVGFLGISNVNTAFGYPSGANYKAWYWSARWFGNGAASVNPTVQLGAGTYRIAINYSNNNIYIKRTTNATIAQSAFPTGASYYLMMMGQGGYNVPGVTILNGGTVSGAGGLY